MLSKLEVALLVEIGFLALDEREFDSAQALFQHLTQVQTANPYPRIGMAMHAYAQGRATDAIEDLQGVLCDFPDAVFTRSLLAQFMKQSQLPGWEKYARDALARVQVGVAADLARSLLGSNAVGPDAERPLAASRDVPADIMARRA